MLKGLNSSNSSRGGWPSASTIGSGSTSIIPISYFLKGEALY